MKSFNEAAQAVIGGVPPAPAPIPPSGRGGHGCAANACLLAGTLSENTRGAGPWYCAEHFFRGDKHEDEVTLRVRNALARGEILQAPREKMPRQQTDAERAMKTQLRPRVRELQQALTDPPAPSAPPVERDRIPGEDDE